MYNPLTRDINSDKMAANYKSDLKKAVPTIDVAFVGKLLSDILGVESPVYLPTWWSNREYHPEAYPDVKQKEEDPAYEGAPNRFGNKVFGAFWIKGGAYSKYEPNGELKTDLYSDFLMPVATIVEFSKPKKVIKTPTIGALGTVKEVFAMEDWNISINGIILPDKDNSSSFRSVAEQMKTIQKFHEIAGNIGVEGQIFSEKDITSMVTESLKFTPISGRPNMMQYSIQAVSDKNILMML